MICPKCSHEWKPERKKREVEQVTFDGKKFTGITPDYIGYWTGQFPAVNIELELHKMEAWLYANPKNRKSKYVRFITNWLSKTQDKAPRVQSYPQTQYKSWDGLM